MDGTVGTILILIIVLAVVALIIRSMVRDKRAGKSVICGVDCKSCGGCCSSCAGCPRAGACRTDKETVSGKRTDPRLKEMAAGGKRTAVHNA